MGWGVAASRGLCQTRLASVGSLWAGLGPQPGLGPGGPSVDEDMEAQAQAQGGVKKVSGHPISPGWHRPWEQAGRGWRMKGQPLIPSDGPLP